MSSSRVEGVSLRFEPNTCTTRSRGRGLEQCRSHLAHVLTRKADLHLWMSGRGEMSRPGEEKKGKDARWVRERRCCRGIQDSRTG